MFNSVFFLQIKHILTKKNFEMFFRVVKINTFSVFHVESQNYLIQDSFISFDTNIWLLWFSERVKK